MDQQLQENVVNACNELGLNESQIQNLLPYLKYNDICYDSIRWKHVTFCSYILLALDEFEIQNVNHMLDIKRAFQFVVSLGLLPNLIPGVGLDIDIRFKSADKFPIEEITIKEQYYRLCAITTVLLKCLEMTKLRLYVVEKHLNDLLAALLQLTNAPLKKPNESSIVTEEFYAYVLEQRKKFQTDLRNLILNTHQPLVFRELMFLYGNSKSPMWLRNCVLQILMERLVARNGVESFVRAILEVQTVDIGTNWRHWDVLVKILMTKPKFVNEDDYYENICGQLISLLHKKTFDEKVSKNFEQALVLCTRYLYETNEKMCVNYFITNITELFHEYVTVREPTVLPVKQMETYTDVLVGIFVANKVDEKIIPLCYLKSIVFVLFDIFHHCPSLKIIGKNIAELLTRYVGESNANEKQDLFEYFLWSTNLKRLAQINKNYTLTVVEGTVQFVEKTQEENLFSRGNSCLLLLESTRNDALVCSFVTYLLASYVKFIDRNELDVIEKKIVLSQLLSKLLEEQLVLKNLKEKRSEMLIFCENLLHDFSEKKVHVNREQDDEQFQLLFITIMIVKATADDSKLVLQTDFTILYNVLKKISEQTSNNEVKILIGEILLANKNARVNPTEFDEAIDKVCSPLISEQGRGLASLVSLIHDNDEPTMQRKQYVLNIFQQHLKSDESFIYLRAIAGLSALCEAFPNTVLETLTDEYIAPKGVSEKHIETRMKLGEVLVRTTASLGEIIIKHKAILLNTFLTVTRDDDPLMRASALSNLAQVCEALGFRLGTMITEVRGNKHR